MMTIMTNSPLTQKLAASPPAKLVSLAASDIAEVSQFIAAQSGREPAKFESHLRWLLLENPARDNRIPLGCGLRSQHGDLVGCILYVPQFFRYLQQTILVIGSSCFYVDQRYRGNGGLIFLKFTELGKSWPLFGNSANAEAASVWKARHAAPIPSSDHELFGVLRWQGLIEEALHRRSLPKALAQTISLPAALLVDPIKRLRLEADPSHSLQPLRSAEEVIQLRIHDPAPVLTADRDLHYIRWRYFSGRDRTVAVFAFKNQHDSELLVTVNQRPRGYREQIRTLNVLDIYPRVGAEVCASIAAALIKRYRDVHAIVLRGMDKTHQDLFRSLGFIRRQFDAPNGWFLDKSGFLPTRNWYTVPADGDWII